MQAGTTVQAGWQTAAEDRAILDKPAAAQPVPAPAALEQQAAASGAAAAAEQPAAALTEDKRALLQNTRLGASPPTQPRRPDCNSFVL